MSSHIAPVLAHRCKDRPEPSGARGGCRHRIPPRARPLGQEHPGGPRPGSVCAVDWRALVPSVAPATDSPRVHMALIVQFSAAGAVTLRYVIDVGVVIVGIVVGLRLGVVLGVEAVSVTIETHKQCN